MDGWLDRNQYRRIHAKAKKLGANNVDTKHLSHCAYWKSFKVYFAFKPFKCMVAAIDTKPIDCDDINLLSSELDNVKEFANYLKELNKNLVEGDMMSV
jgi:hypothetical protein